ncbi:MAG: MGMT family protein [Prolixibacteraceae bacterium]|nr:MGMT family protein [Prolixibacteraceae bacterium]
MNDFYSKVYDVVKLIPAGRVTSYGAIAAYLGIKSSARAVGWAMNASRTADGFIPAHRVVNRNGLLTGKHFFDSPTAMCELLENEGIAVIDDCIVNFAEVFWNPAKELDLFNDF